MPTSPPYPSSQGSSVSFAGSELGALLSIQVTGATAGSEDITSLSSAVDGTGDATRVMKTLEPLSLEPGRVSVTFFGGVSGLTVGAKGSLSASVGDLSISGEAYLVSFDIDAQVGDLVKGSATFQLTGA